jgi:hypothetical protein
MDQGPSQQPEQNPYQSQPYPTQQNSYQQQPYPPQQPYPMQFQQQAPKPRRRGCLIGGIVAAIVVVALIAVIAASSDHASTSTSNIGTLAAATSNTDATQATTKTFKVGDVVTVGTTWQVTVNGVKTSTGGDFITPNAGNIYLEISVTLKNLSSQEQTVSTLAFWTLKDSTGQAYDQTFLTGAPKAPDGKVAAGDKLTGTLPYEVPLTQKQFELAFSPDFGSSGQTIWNLTIQ